jgi:FkbM family methyltransferase
MEKIIHFTVPKDMTSAQAEVIERAKALHKNWNVMVWRDPIKEDNYLLEKYWPRANSGAQFADLLRIDILYRFGGIYLDSDVVIFKSLECLAARYEFFVASEDGIKNITNAVIGARKGNLALRDLIDDLLEQEPDWARPPSETTGPLFFTRKLRWRRDVTILPRETFYPYSYWPGSMRKAHRHSYGEHLWDFSWGSKESAPASPKRLTAVQRSISSTKKWTKAVVLPWFARWERFRCIDPVYMRRKQLEHVRFYQAKGELVVQTVHNLRMVVDGRDLSLTPEILFRGSYELPEQTFLEKIVSGGDWVIDVGSNVGSFCLLAAQCVGPLGRVFAYEPNPRPYELMAKSLVMNWMHERVVQRPVAVGDRRDTVELNYSPYRLGDSQVGEVANSTFGESMRVLDGDRIKISVPLVQLDEEFPIDLPIKVLKIDVEGHEGLVLAGANRLLRNRCVDYVIMELLEEVGGAYWSGIIKKVEEVLNYGYEIGTLTDTGQLVKHKNVANALSASSRNIVLVAKDQYRVTGTWSRRV